MKTWTAKDLEKIFNFNASTLRGIQRSANEDLIGFKPEKYHGRGNVASEYTLKNLVQFQVYLEARKMGIPRSMFKFINNWVDIIFRHFDETFLKETFNLQSTEEKDRALECLILKRENGETCSILIHTKFKRDQLGNLTSVESEHFGKTLSLGENRKLTEVEAKKLLFEYTSCFKVNFTCLMEDLREKVKKI